MSLSQQAWPSVLWIVRHGESAGNVARDAAEQAGQPVIDIADRDMDVPLSALGERQARALGDWFGRQPPAQRPNVVLTSPHRRAQQTAALITEGERTKQKPCASWMSACARKSSAA